MTSAIPAVRRRRSFQPLPFAPSAPLSIGTEVEAMLIHPADGAPAPAARGLLNLLAVDRVRPIIRAERTQSMLEITGGVHAGTDTLRTELQQAAGTLQSYVKRLGLAVVGGGAHPFCDWRDQLIFPTPRFQRVADTYGYLAKQLAVLSQYVHIGVTGGDEALYLVHGLAHFVPHLVALTAASPFWRGVDTGFDCSRLNVSRALPLSGHAPPVLRWTEFSRYVARLHEAGIIESVKDLYWDIRPRPDLGTVEVRVCDSPLSVASAADVAALIHTLARRLLLERLEPDLEKLYLYYEVNRFRAARYGLAAECVESSSGSVHPLIDSLEEILDAHAGHARALNTTAALERLRHRIRTRTGDAAWLRALIAHERDPGRAMQAVAARWF